MISVQKSGIALGLLLAWTAAGAPPAASAQDAAALYGQGVHAYFAGSAAQAERYLSSAVALNQEDPRIYYFRALARLRLGRGDEARRDMQTGARLEAQAPNRFAVGSALTRVQGRERLTLERYREQARADAATQRDEWRRARYQEVALRDAEVLRRPVIVALDDFAPVTGPRLPADALAAPAPQVMAPPAEAEPLPTEPPTRAVGDRPEPLVADDPFGDDPFGDDPFEDAPFDEAFPAAEPGPAVEAAATPRGDVEPLDEAELFSLDFPPVDEAAQEAPAAEADDAQPDEDVFGIDHDDPFGDL